MALRPLFAALVLVALLAPGAAHARGGDYVFEGGSEEAREQVRAALEASRFDWDVVPGTVTIRITRCGCAGATPGEIVLDEDVLTSSPWGERYAWGIVQHEFAHQVDFLMLSPWQRAKLQRQLGAPAWCWETFGHRHDDYGCERVATMVAWAFWPSASNVQRPSWARPGTSTAPWPRRFRALFERMVDGASLRLARQAA